ncbi:MAG TPA: hypothetical protein VFY00_03725, partial [Arenimonas sp.]|nr:hypothetical protein [Arenimonas sp.]
MGSDRNRHQATATIRGWAGRVWPALAWLPLLVALVEWLASSGTLPRAWPGALSLLAPLLAGAGVWLRADRRVWMLMAWALAFASLAVAWLAWPVTAGQGLRNPAPWLAAIAAAIGIGANVGGSSAVVGLLARSLGGFLVVLCGLALCAVFDPTQMGRVAMGVGPSLAYLGLGAWLMARDLAPGPLHVLRFCTALLAGLALLVMTGWWLHVPEIVQGGTNDVPMQFNTAFSAFLIAAALRLLVSGRRNLAVLPLVPVVVVCLASLLEEYGGLDLGTGEWLFRHTIVAEGVLPGRMAPNTATAYLLACLGIALAPSGAHGSPTRWSGTWACGFVIAVIGSIVLAGFVLQMPALRGWGAYTPMALMTAVALLLIGVGLGAAGSEHRWALVQRSGWVPLAVAVAAIGVSLLVWFQIDRGQAASRAQALQRSSESVEQALLGGVADRAAVLRRMAHRMAAAPDESARMAIFDLDAGIYLEDFPAFVDLVWAGPDRVARRQQHRPGESVAILGRKLDSDPLRRALFELAMRKKDV